jgi:hypothetical protein
MLYTPKEEAPAVLQLSDEDLKKLRTEGRLVADRLVIVYVGPERSAAAVALGGNARTIGPDDIARAGGG